MLKGDVLSQMGNTAKALDAYAEGRRQLLKLVRENPDVPGYKERLATADLGAAQLHLFLADEGLKREPSESGPPADGEAGKSLEQAAGLLEEVVSTLEPVVSGGNAHAGVRHDLAAALWLLGDVYRLQKRPSEAKAQWDKGLSVLEPLRSEFEKNPDCAQKWELLQESLRNLGTP